MRTIECKNLMDLHINLGASVDCAAHTSGNIKKYHMSRAKAWLDVIYMFRKEHMKAWFLEEKSIDSNTKVFVSLSTLRNIIFKYHKEDVLTELGAYMYPNPKQKEKIKKRLSEWLVG